MENNNTALLCAALAVVTVFAPVAGIIAVLMAGEGLMAWSTAWIVAGAGATLSVLAAWTGLGLD